MVDLGTLIEHYGYIGIFFILIFGIIGLPLPDEVLLTYVGYNVFLGKMSLQYSLLIATLGAIIGISISYVLGLKLGLPFIKRFGPKVKLTDKKIYWAQSRFKKYGGFFILIGYFIPGVRHITAYLAGMSTYYYLTFALFAYLGAILWTTTFITLGLLLGNNWTVVEYIFHHFSKGILFVFIAGVIHLFLRYRKNPRNTNNIF